MAKRFIDTGIFDDDWFMELSKDSKLLWLYFITKCDHAGIIKLNEKLCKLQTEIKDIPETIKQLGNRIVIVHEHLYFIPKFIEYQYPGFPNSKVRQQSSALDILTKYGLWDGEKINSLVTLNKELNNSYVNVNGNDNGLFKEEPIKKYIYSEFYDKEIELSINDENYIEVVKVLYGKNSYDKPLNVLLKMPTQLSYRQFLKIWKLKQEYGFIISVVLEKIENWGNHKKNTTVYGTFLTFIKNDDKRIKLK